MQNDSIKLFRAWSSKFTANRVPLEPSAEAKTILAIIDHFNGLHWADRNRLSEKVAKVHTADHPE